MLLVDENQLIGWALGKGLSGENIRLRIKEKALSGEAVQFLEKPFPIAAVQVIPRSALEDFPGKRRHPRYLCNFPLSVGILVPCPGDGSDGAFPLRGTAVDVGQSGIRLSPDQPLAIGQQLCLTAEREGGPFEKFVPPRTKAEVVWVVPQADGCQAGLRFAG